MDSNTQKGILKIRKLEKTYVIFCRGTRQVYITCDEETYEDQIWVFSSEEQAKTFGERRVQENKDILYIVRLENEQLLQFYGGLYGLGVTEIVFTDGEDVVKIPLEKLVQKPDFSKLPKEKQPLTNPQMQLTGLYFMQEIHRRLPNSEKPRLKELEEEMAVNLVRSRFLMVMEALGEKKDVKGSDLRLPCVRNKEGKMFQPIFTDPAEYRKFDKDQRFLPAVVEFTKIEQVLGKDIEGIVVNPMSTNIIITTKIIPALLKRFAAGGEDNGGETDKA